jgi:LemA protein
MIEWLILGVLLLVVFWLIVTYNRFIMLRNRIDNSWQQIDVQLKRRYDLIPNLVETVKGYAKHEKDTLTKVTQMRAGLMTGTPDERMAASNMLTQALGKLFAVAEAYPQLKANENFVKLQEELAGTENKIAYVRTAYNDTVLEYNNSTQVFPGSLIAGMFGFGKKGGLEASEQERQNVQVKF